MPAEGPENTPGQTPGERGRRLRRAAFILLVLGAVLLAWRFWPGRHAIRGPCDVVRICDPVLFREQCEKAAAQAGIESALAILGKPAEERCSEESTSCEVEIPGGKGPLFDGCIVEYEKGTGRILASRWYGF